MDKQMNLENYLDETAYKCFRDVADEDYICARMAFKAHLSINFHWLSLQSIEKYIKCALLLNRKKAKFGHDLEKGLNEAMKIKFFQIDTDTEKFIHYINEYGSTNARYLGKSTSLIPSRLKSLDKAIWEIRRYCIKPPIDLKHFQKNNCIPLLEKRFNQFPLHNGFLEQILDGNSGPTKDGLIWCNPLCGSTEIVPSMHISGRNIPNTYSLPKDSETQLQYLNELKKYIN
jgi:HEPN domain-containing protein